MTFIQKFIAFADKNPKYTLASTALQLMLADGALVGKDAHDILTRAELHDAAVTIRTFREYLDTNPQDALVSSDPVLKALAIIDWRVGQRTLSKIRIGKTAHSLVRKLHSLRVKGATAPIVVAKSRFH